MGDPLYIMQNSFSGGELSPVMDARQDLDKYSSGVKKMKNFYVLAHGAAVNRPGTYFIAETKDSSKKSRLIPFQFSSDQTYVIEFGNLYCRFYRAGSQLKVDSVPYEIATPYLETDLPDLKFAQSADVIYIVHPKYAPRILSRYGDTNWTLTEFAYHDGPFMPINLVDTTKITPSDIAGDITITTNADVFNTAEVGSLFKIEHDVEAQSVTNSLTTTSDGYSSIIYREPSAALTVVLADTWVGSIQLQKSIQDAETGTYGSWSAVATYTANGTNVIPTSTSRTRYRLKNAGITSGYCTASMSTAGRTIKTTFTTGTSSEVIKGRGTWTLTTHGTWTADILLQKSEDQGATWKTLRSYSSAGDYNVAASGTEDDVCLLRLFSNDFSSGTLRLDLAFEPFTQQGIVRLTGITDARNATATVINELGSTNDTNLFYHGAWSEYAGYPCSVVFFQNRLFFGGTAKQPQTVWGSQSGDYINFGVSSPVVDSDAITIPLVSEQVNTIKNMKSLDKIIGFTSGGNWKIGSGSDSSAITPTSISAVQQGYYGASSLTPLSIGNRMIYAEEKGSAVRDIGYDYTSDSYVGNELTILAEHLFRNRSIIDWAYAQEPTGIVWCMCDDGTLLGFTYLVEQKVWGWHRHETDGLFESVCVISGDGRDEVWFIVNRTVNGVTKRYVEQMASRNPTVYYATDSDGEQYSYIKSEDSYFVDCGITYRGEATSTITGLDHLEGKTVSILANGNVHPQKVVSSGLITLDYPVTVCHVGLPYVSDIETLNIDIPLKTGTIQTRFKKINQVTLRMEDSRNAFVGTSFSKMYELKVRQNESWDEPVRVFSGDKDITLSSGSTKEGRVCIRMKDPLPITLLALVTQVTIDG